MNLELPATGENTVDTDDTGAPLVIYTKRPGGGIDLVIGIDEKGLDAIRIGGLFNFGTGRQKGLPTLEVQIILKSELRSAIEETGLMSRTNVVRTSWGDG